MEPDYGEEAGHDWAGGLCVDIGSGQTRYQFPVCRFLDHPRFNVSVPHQLFAMSAHSMVRLVIENFANYE
jgi:hypothetical protein